MTRLLYLLGLPAKSSLLSVLDNHIPLQVEYSDNYVERSTVNLAKPTAFSVELRPPNHSRPNGNASEIRSTPDFSLRGLTS